MAKNEFEACLMSSALLMLVTTQAGSGPSGRAAGECTEHLNFRSSTGR